MTEADIRRVLEQNFMPKDTETERWLGLKSYTVNYGIAYEPGSQGIRLVPVPTGTTELSLTFAVERFLPAHQSGMLPEWRKDRWELLEHIVCLRVNRDDMASLFGEE